MFRNIKEKRISGFSSSHEIITPFEEEAASGSFFAYLGNLIQEKRHNGKLATSENYLAVLKSFKTFRNGEDICLKEINAKIIVDYEKFLFSCNLCHNTVSFYMRILRAVYNRAIEDEIINPQFPFKKVYTCIDKTTKRALNISSLKKIKSMDLACKPSLEFARDMFLLSFYMRGISFVDLAFLRKKDLNNGRVKYRRRKTGQVLEI